jgi:GcvH upstream region-like protein
MLEFFRRYQRGFFIVITAVIVISFSFFGTYSAMHSKEEKDEVAFTAVNGKSITKIELHDVVRFISVGSNAHLYWNVEWGENPFNDQVISKDFLETGLAEVVVAPFLDQLKDELQTRLEKEKRYVPYAHPQAPFVGVENVWHYFAPNIKKHVDTLKNYTDAATPEAFSTRVQLFLAERQFPATYLKRMIKYQESEQSSWLEPDESLHNRDLALFGYHSTEDWFGNNFLTLMAQYIINTAAVAEEKGLQVTLEEARAGLYNNVEESFKQAQNNPYFAVQNINDYYTDSLRRLGMDEVRLAKIWQRVMLFRRYFLQNRESILVSPLAFEEFYKRMNECVTVEVYKLPSELCFQKMSDVQKFQLYVNGVRDPKFVKRENELLVPRNFLPVSEIKKIAPELVQKKYRLRYATCSQDLLQAKIGLRATWDWQVQNASWKKLQNKFAQLGAKKAETEDARRFLLDSLDPKTRNLVDSFSRQEIVKEHPEWIQEALDRAPKKEEELYVREQGGKMPLLGIKDRHALMVLLDKAKLGEGDPSLSLLSQDGNYYHNIVVLERPGVEEILTYKQALQDGTIDALYKKTLESAYVRARTQKPSSFLQENGEWKPLEEVKDQVAATYFEDLANRLDQECEKEEKNMPYFCTWKNREKARVAVRMLPYMKEIWKKAKESSFASFLQGDKEATQNPLLTQWLLVRATEKVTRRGKGFSVDQLEAFSLKGDLFSKLRYKGKAGVTFFKVLEKGALTTESEVREKVYEARALLGHSIELELGAKLRDMMQQKGALLLR